MRLAGAGHRDVFEYGWSAFVEALEAEAQRRDERMKDAALALRVALHTDGRQFKAWKHRSGRWDMAAIRWNSASRIRFPRG